MKKHEARVVVEYRFTFNSDKISIPDLEFEADKIWNDLVTVGEDSNKYHDTKITVF